MIVLIIFLVFCILPVNAAEHTINLRKTKREGSGLCNANGGNPMSIECKLNTTGDAVWLREDYEGEVITLSSGARTPLDSAVRLAGGLFCGRIASSMRDYDWIHVKNSNGEVVRGMHLPNSVGVKCSSTEKYIIAYDKHGKAFLYDRRNCKLISTTRNSNEEVLSLRDLGSHDFEFNHNDQYVFARRTIHEGEQKYSTFSIYDLRRGLGEKLDSFDREMYSRTICSTLNSDEFLEINGNKIIRSRISDFTQEVLFEGNIFVQSVFYSKEGDIFFQSTSQEGSDDQFCVYKITPDKHFSRFDGYECHNNGSDADPIFINSGHKFMKLPEDTSKTYYTPRSLAAGYNAATQQVILQPDWPFNHLIIKPLSDLEVID